MILSHAHRFVFFHNPKAGGTSVRATLESLHDEPKIFWGSETGAGGDKVDLAHLGVDEFAAHCPALWKQVRGYALYSLRREPVGRFFSSLAEYSKLHGTTDTRFAAPARRREELYALVERLKSLGQAEAVMGHHELRHFRPQWIYWRAADPEVHIRSWPVERLDAFLAEVGTLAGSAIVPQTRNRQDRLYLPGPLGRIASHRRFKRIAGALPGAGAAKRLLRSRFAATGTTTEAFGLDGTDMADITAFVQHFYARDLADWPREP